MIARCIVTGLLFAVFSPQVSWSIDTDELPYGIYFSYFANTVAASTIDSMSNLLGFNLVLPMEVWTGITQPRLQFFRNYGMDVIPYMINPNYPIVREYFRNYLRSHYMIMQAEDDVSEIRFLYPPGSRQDSSGWYLIPASDTAFVALDDLWYKHEKGYLAGPVVQYEPFLHMFIDDTGLDPGDTVAIFNVWASWPQWWEYYDNPDTVHGGVIHHVPILAGDFFSENPDTLDLGDFQFLEYFVDTVQVGPDSVRYDTIGSSVLTYQLVSTGVCPLGVDWLKVYNWWGKELVEDSLYDSEFADYCQEPWVDSTILYWHLRDDIYYDQLIPSRHMNEIIQANSSKIGIDKNDLSFVVSPYEYVEIARPRIWMENIYPFFGGSGYADCYAGDKTLFYGTGWGDGEIGLQRSLDRWVTYQLDTIMTAIGDSVDLWFITQMQRESITYCPDSVQIKRRPTGPEISCEAFIGLSYGARAVVFWPYGWRAAHSGDYHYYTGFLDSLDNLTESWPRIENYVSPNLKAIDQYLSDSAMTWERSYRSCNYPPAWYPYPLGPPPGALVSEIVGWSDSFNPDSGWCQVGEFRYGNTDTLYILLVNRACSKDDSGTEAPPQHFRLKLNPSVVGSDYAYIIDLADSVYSYYRDSTNMRELDYMGVHDTTYSAKLYGTIPFTATLKAGEGRLFKIVPTSEIELSGI